MSLKKRQNQKCFVFSKIIDLALFFGLLFGYASSETEIQKGRQECKGISKIDHKITALSSL